jgi:hypothetical protein
MEKEVMVVIDIAGEYGWARRQGGRDIFIHINSCIDVPIERLERWNLLKPGVPIYAGTAMRNGRLRAANIELYSEAEILETDPEYVRPVSKNVLEYSKRHENTPREPTSREREHKPRSRKMSQPMMRNKDNWWQRFN